MDNHPESNAAVDKLSPLLPLTNHQRQLVDQIKSFCRHYSQRDVKEPAAVFVVEGDAGTGKSVVLSHLFTEIQHAARKEKDSPLYGTRNYFVVNHPEILKVYKEIAGSRPGMYKKDFERPTSLINRMDKQKQSFDIAIVDEAHLLLSKPDHYNNFYHENQLTELMRLAKVVVVVFDSHQVLRMKSFWDDQRLQKMVRDVPHQWIKLHHQFRMTASDALVEWFDHFTDDYQVTPLPSDARQNYDFRIYDDAEEMRQAIVRRNSEMGLSRILSTSGYPSTLDGGKHYIHEGHFKMPWDQYNYTATPWAEIPKTIDEVGSIYTCQGFDLNYAGIIIGPPIHFVKGSQNKLDVDLSKYTDVEAFKHRKDITDPKEFERLEKKMVMNSLNVLFKRGVHGTYLFAHDPALRRLLVKLFEQAGFTNPKN